MYAVKDKVYIKHKNDIKVYNILLKRQKSH